MSNSTKMTVLVSFTALLCSASEREGTGSFEITSGSAIFSSPTNVAGVEVKGKSSSVSGRVEISRDANGLVMTHMEALLPVRSLATGMKVRDEHMRKYIFTTNDGKEPDIRFSAEKTTCAGTESARDFTCSITGTLSIRGITREYRITLSVKDPSGSLQSLRATGDGIVKLSSYGISRPTQFGVTSSDEVNLHLDLLGKQSAVPTSGVGSTQ